MLSVSLFNSLSFTTEAVLGGADPAGPVPWASVFFVPFFAIAQAATSALHSAGLLGAIESKYQSITESDTPGMPLLSMPSFFVLSLVLFVSLRLPHLVWMYLSVYLFHVVFTLVHSSLVFCCAIFVSLCTSVCGRFSLRPHSVFLSSFFFSFTLSYSSCSVSLSACLSSALVTLP